MILVNGDAILNCKHFSINAIKTILKHSSFLMGEAVARKCSLKKVFLKTL